MTVSGANLSSCNTIIEMERLRNELYRIVNGKRERLNKKEICKVSQELDKLIVKHMYEGMTRKASMDV